MSHWPRGARGDRDDGVIRRIRRKSGQGSKVTFQGPAASRSFWNDPHRACPEKDTHLVWGRTGASGAEQKDSHLPSAF